MQNFGDRLKQLLIDAKVYKDVDQKKWLKAKTGTSMESARKWLAGINEPAEENMQAIAKGLGMTVAQLRYADLAEAPGLYGIRSDEDAPQDGDVTVEVADIELAAGGGVAAPSFIEVKYRHTYRADWLRANNINDPAALKTCRVRGASMERVLFDGDKVLVDTANKRVVEDGVFALLVADQLKVKRLRRRRDGGLLIVSDNQDYPIEEIPPEELESVLIIGRVVDKSGRGGL